jgi:predicted permease
MDAERKNFNFFVRRWQLRLFILGIILPALLFFSLAIVLRMETDVVGIGCTFLGAVFLLVALILQGWRFER